MLDYFGGTYTTLNHSTMLYCDRCLEPRYEQNTSYVSDTTIELKKKKGRYINIPNRTYSQPPSWTFLSCPCLNISPTRALPGTLFRNDSSLSQKLSSIKYKSLVGVVTATAHISPFPPKTTQLGIYCHHHIYSISLSQSTMATPDDCASILENFRIWIPVNMLKSVLILS